MPLREMIDISRFLKQVQLCKGEVEFYTREGDCLNLKSALSKYLFAAVTADKELAHAGEVRCQVEGDYDFLADFLLVN